MVRAPERLDTILEGLVATFQEYYDHTHLMTTFASRDEIPAYRARDAASLHAVSKAIPKIKQILKEARNY